MSDPLWHCQIMKRHKDCEHGSELSGYLEIPYNGGGKEITRWMEDAADVMKEFFETASAQNPVTKIWLESQVDARGSEKRSIGAEVIGGRYGAR
jgi:hypothetical protein